MTSIPLAMICTCDLAGQVRGKALPLDRLGTKGGIGWTPTNSQITAHGPIAPSPFGAKGDTFLQADLSTLIDLEIANKRHERFVLADIVELDGTPWSCCPRAFLKRQLAGLKAFGYDLVAAFEHEFAYLGDPERPNSSYALSSFRAQGPFAERLFAVLEEAGLAIDTFMPEYGPSQFEITIGPKLGLRAADEAVVLRELVRATALAHDRRASFAPLLRPGAVGNGVHVHFSLRDLDGRPVNYDPTGPLGGIAPKAGAFLEGIRRLMPAILAISAAGTVSYQRLQPNRWSAYLNNIALQDREGALRVCPTFGADKASAFHFEYRAADATASPYMLLGAMVAAGLHGLRQGWTLNPSATGERLPQNLESALEAFEANAAIEAAMGKPLHGLYAAHKRFEAQIMGQLSEDEQCSRYVEAY